MNIKSIVIVNQTIEGYNGVYSVSNPHVVNFHLVENKDLYMTIDNIGFATYDPEEDDPNDAIGVNRYNQSVIHFRAGMIIYIHCTIQGGNKKTVKIVGKTKSIEIDDTEFSSPKEAYDKIIDLYGIGESLFQKFVNHVPERDGLLLSQIKAERDKLGKK